MIAVTRPRIAPGGFFELGPINWLLCRVISRVAGTPDAHLFSTLGRQRRLFRGWLLFAARMMPGGTLCRQETELVILRVAHLRQCQYELDHHRRIGGRRGLSAEVVARALVGPDADGWSDRQRALLSAVDSMIRSRNIDDVAWAALRAHYGDAQLVELCLLIGHYDMLAATIATLRIARDARTA